MKRFVCEAYKRIRIIDCEGLSAEGLFLLIAPVQEKYQKLRIDEVKKSIFDKGHDSDPCSGSGSN